MFLGGDYHLDTEILASHLFHRQIISDKIPCMDYESPRPPSGTEDLGLNVLRVRTRSWHRGSSAGKGGGGFILMMHVMIHGWAELQIVPIVPSVGYNDSGETAEKYLVRLYWLVGGMGYGVLRRGCQEFGVLGLLAVLEPEICRDSVSKVAGRVCDM